MASVAIGATGLARIAACFAVRFLLSGLDVLAALVLGARAPFVTGVVALSLEFRARWTFGSLVGDWGVGAVYRDVHAQISYDRTRLPAALAFALTRLSPIVSRAVARVVSGVALAVIPIVLAGTVSGVSLALLAGLGIAHPSSSVCLTVSADRC